ncbi:MAG: DUF1553 domain-containing protein, partial [Planctomycetales bacterium]|nr:DUF1553 domain-containing protein [Planctomycetales bacterium]
MIRNFVRDCYERRGIVCVSALAILFSGTLLCGAEEPDRIEFSRQVLPILSGKCFTCHGPDAKHRKGDLRLDLEDAAKESAVVAGDADASELIARITSDDEDLHMPPAATGKVVSPEEIEILRNWINAGAPWSQHWAFIPPAPVPVPQVDSNWPQNEIDHFVLARLQAESLQPSSPAQRAAWLRRVSLDLIGLPPTPAEVTAFEDDQSAGAYEAAVDRLLESPHYGERLAIEWLDLARFADTNGYQNDFNRSMWPWRDWVINAFNQNLPGDQFIVEQLAGDLLPNPTQSQLIATGFNRNNRTVTEGGSIDEEWRVENVVDRVETTATTFLALTMGCSRCHDHKYDPIDRHDFYQFFAFFNNVDEQGVYTETRGNVAPLISLPTPEQTTQLADLDRKISELQTNIDAAEGDTKEQLGQQLKTLQEERASITKNVQTTMVMRDRAEYRPTYLLQRGQYDLPDTSEPLWPEVPKLLGQLPDGVKHDRLALANWLVAPNHPLTARVMVNRIWQRMFGVGLVATPDNFGVQGDPPSHPELLDWLALRLIESGWDLKQMHKLICLSATYQQTSDAAADLIARDPKNRLLARGPRHRLPAELIRDYALAVSGLLVDRIGGPSVKPYQPAGLWDELAGGANGGPYEVAQDDNLYRRSLYTFRKRTVSHPTLGTFDAPSWEICQAKRSQTNTPLQALALLNDLTYVETARHLGMRMLAEGGDTLTSRLKYGFTLATLRQPTATEVTKLIAGYNKYLQYFEEQPANVTLYLSQGMSQVPA